MQDFVSEDDLETFEGWLRYQAVDALTTPAEELAKWHCLFEEMKEHRLSSPKVGLMKLRRTPGQHLYAVAVREDSELWLALWIKRSADECFVFMPCNDRKWNPHNSYHRKGEFHMKSYDHIIGQQQVRQTLTGEFRGTENLGMFMGPNPKYVGAVCDPAVFSGVVEVAPGVLGSRKGGIVVDLIEPGREPMSILQTVVQQEVFRDTLPWIVIRIF